MSYDFKRELTTWLCYLFIMFIAATVAGSFYEESMLPPSGAGVGNARDHAVNVHEMIRSLWRDYYRWWLGVFMGLSAVRFLFLFIKSKWFKSKLA
jgi:ABC-type multidrug transport system permease subunit